MLTPYVEEYISSIKFLAVHLDPHLTWDEHENVLGKN